MEERAAGKGRGGAHPDGDRVGAKKRDRAICRAAQPASALRPPRDARRRQAAKREVWLAATHLAAPSSMSSADGLTLHL
eukprot:scaffold99080_cov30-Tisochrysis_lutea.AAC.2